MAVDIGQDAERERIEDQASDVRLRDREQCGTSRIGIVEPGADEHGIRRFELAADGVIQRIGCVRREREDRRLGQERAELGLDRSAVRRSPTRPAPTRSAASPDSITAPGDRRDPPTTMTRPRDFFESPGSGIPQLRRRAGVTCSLRLDIRASGMHGDRGTLTLEVGDGREVDQLPARFYADQMRHRGVEDGVGCRELEQLGLLHRNAADRAGA